MDLRPGEDPNDFNAGSPPPVAPLESTTPKRGSRRPVREPEVVEVVNQATGETIAEIPVAEPKKEEPKAQVPAAPKPQVQLNERGQAQATNLDEMWRMVNVLFKGGGFPKWVRTSEQAMAIAIYLKNLNLEIMTGVQHVCEVNGRLTLWGEGPLAAVRASGKMKSIKEGFYTKDYEEICFKNKNLDADLHFAFCVTVRADNGERKETWFTVNDEKTANKGLKEVWTGYRRTMFKRKARAENLKDNFGDVLQGAGISEYDDESAPDMPVAQPKSLAEKLQERTMIEAPKEGPVGEAVQN